MITSVQAVGDELAAHRLDQADDHAAQHRARHVADAAQHGRGEGAQSGGEADDEAGEVIVQAEDQPAGAGQRRAEEERHHDDRSTSTPIMRAASGSCAVARIALPIFGCLHEEMQADHQQKRDRPRSAPRAVAAPRRR